MANDTSNLSIRDGLITIVSADRFQKKPLADANAHVVVMQQKGKALRHYITLRSPHDRLSLGEEIWGDYTFYIVDMRVRKLHLEYEFNTRDLITNVNLEADIIYRVIDAELVAIAVEDALQILKDELITLLRREIIRLTLEQLTEQHLEAFLQRESAYLPDALGIGIQSVRVTNIEWDKDIIDHLQVRKAERHELEQINRERDEQHSLEDNEVSFTAIYPKEGTVETWHNLLVYVHLASANQLVALDALRFKDQIPLAKKITSSSSTQIIPGTEITIIPSCHGLEFNPDRAMIKWTEDYHRVDFRFWADKSLLNDAASGQINFYVGPVIVGTVKLALLLNVADSKISSMNVEHSMMYHQEDIFISYSHKDSAIVLACKKAYEALGFNVLLDINTLRSGQIWNEELKHMIDRATIFQLFWSENSKKSKYCKQEWKHALKRNRGGFIRPVYWQKPMPKPPEELTKFHFEYVELG